MYSGDLHHSPPVLLPAAAFDLPAGTGVGAWTPSAGAGAAGTAAPERTGSVNGGRKVSKKRCDVGKVIKPWYNFLNLLKCVLLMPGLLHVPKRRPCGTP